MSISDLIVVMKLGVVQQIGKPQSIYDNPTNLFVAKFLGTPPINVFEGQVVAGKLMIGGAAVLDVKGAPDGEVYVGVRPEGFIPAADGKLVCSLSNLEVMGRDVSVVSSHPDMKSATIRSIVDSDYKFDLSSETVAFNLKPHKVFLFDKETENRVYFGDQAPDELSSEA